MLVVARSPRRSKVAKPNNGWLAKPYCDCECWSKRAPVSWKLLNACSCGENYYVSEWKWEQPKDNVSWVVVCDDQKQVTFHPSYSSGTAAVKGDTPLKRGYHYYFEVKILTETYGTDIMVGVGTDKMNLVDSQFNFMSLLGGDGESYGLSYKGVVRHNAKASRNSAGFCRGTIVGVRLDMWHGTLEFYLNRKPQGVCFYNLLRHEALYPMACSTAAQSSMRLTYTSSWRASLLSAAARALPPLAATPRPLPPGLRRLLAQIFWLLMPPTGKTSGEKDVVNDCMFKSVDTLEDDAMDTNSVTVARNVLSEILPSPYVNGFYVDNVERNYRLVVWE